MLVRLSSARIPWAAALLLSACSSAERTPPASAAPGTAQTASAVPAVDTASIAARADRSRIRGDSTAKVWIVIVSDFQCPFCRQWHDEVFPSIVREYVESGRVRLAYVHLPLGNHQNAFPAAEAAMCAGVQGRFWEMHDAIFRTMGQWAGMPEPHALFDSLASGVGVNRGPYRSCIETRATRALIESDARRVGDAGVAATPTFFVGDEKIEGAAGLADFRTVVERALARAGATR
jgi:protein-disulfide isomerase